jgi:hypothetical protein
MEARIEVWGAAVLEANTGILSQERLRMTSRREKRWAGRQPEERRDGLDDKRKREAMGWMTSRREKRWAG